MKGLVLLCTVAALGTACAIVAEGGQQAGPEQNRFDMRPGSGLGAQADALGGGLGDEVIRSEHLAWVDTPLGRVDILDTVELIEGSENRCRALVTSSFASKTCGVGLRGPQPTEIISDGTTSDGDWQLVEVRAGETVQALRATADDGTVYEATVVRGVGLVVYPIERGGILIQGLGPGGAPVGAPIPPGGAPVDPTPSDQ